LVPASFNTEWVLVVTTLVCESATIGSQQLAATAAGRRLENEIND
jgi:hypothetical protein